MCLAQARQAAPGSQASLPRQAGSQAGRLLPISHFEPPPCQKNAPPPSSPCCGGALGRPALRAAPRSAFSWAAIALLAVDCSPHGIVLCGPGSSSTTPHTHAQRLRATRGPTAHPHPSAAAPSLKPPQPPAAIGCSASARLRNKRVSRHGPSPLAAPATRGVDFQNALQNTCPKPPPQPPTPPPTPTPHPAPPPPPAWLPDATRPHTTPLHPGAPQNVTVKT